MRLIVDTSVWSLFLRRPARDLSPSQHRVLLELRGFIRDGQVVMLGAIRQELLTGLGDADAFARLRAYIGWFPDEPTGTGDRERAALFSNDLRRRGIQASHVDALICSVAARLGSPVFTTDTDFVLYAGVLPVSLYPISSAM